VEGQAAISPAIPLFLLLYLGTKPGTIRPLLIEGSAIMKFIRRDAMVVLLSALALLWSPFTAKTAQLSQTDQAALVQLEKEAWDVAKQKKLAGI
jgi:hypothetical protein